MIHRLLSVVRRHDVSALMKTSVAEAQELARHEKTVLKALFEEGLPRGVDEHQSRAAFQLRDASFRGQGFQPEFAGASWASIQAAIYDEA
jgi:hypothetical protein